MDEIHLLVQSDSLDIRSILGTSDSYFNRHDCLRVNAKTESAANMGDMLD